MEAAERLLDTLPALMVTVSTGGPAIKPVEADSKTADFACFVGVLP